MRVTTLRIENFRGIKRLDLDRFARTMVRRKRT